MFLDYLFVESGFICQDK